MRIVTLAVLAAFIAGTSVSARPPAKQRGACAKVTDQYRSANDDASRYMALGNHIDDDRSVQAKEANVIARVSLLLEQGRAAGCKMPALAPDPEKYDMEARGCAVGAILSGYGSGTGQCNPMRWKGER